MQADFSARIQAAGARFLSRAAEACDRLEAAIPGLRAGRRGDLLALVREDTHRLAGGAGSFGLPVVSRIAEDADAAVLVLIATPEGSADRLVELLERLVAEVRSHAR